MSRSNDIIEALIEMHFHASLMEKFASRYGKGAVQLYKPSQNQERLVGFDSAFQIGPNLSRDQFIANVTAEVKTGKRVSQYLTFYLQFKVVERLDGFGFRPNSPVTVTLKKATGGNLPYYRAELDLRPPKAGSSNCLTQHETLVALSGLPKSNVRYACGMLFSSDQLWEKPDLADLRMVPVRRNAPHASYKAAERHFILFKNKNAVPLWCSEPHEGESQTVDEWMTELRPQDAEEFLSSLHDERGPFFHPDPVPRARRRIPASLRIIQLSDHADEASTLPPYVRRRP